MMSINVLLCCVMLLWYGMLCYVKGIKQRRACFYPVLETCYDAAEHEKASRENETKPSFLSALRVFGRVIACF